MGKKKSMNMHEAHMMRLIIKYLSYFIIYITIKRFFFIGFLLFNAQNIIKFTCLESLNCRVKHVKLLILNSKILDNFKK